MRKISILAILWLLTAVAIATTSAHAEVVIPQLNKSYYIASQTWDGKQYVERILTNTSGSVVSQESEVGPDAKWRVTGADADGAVTLLSPINKRLMTGGISSGTNVRNLVSVPSEWTVADHPLDAVVILCKYNNKYIVARNDGANMNGEYTSSMTGYNPKTAAYTQYFKFYDADNAYLTVAPNYGGTGAVFEFVPDDGEPNGGQPLRGNLWEMESGTLSLVPDSYDTSKFIFKGFRVNGGELQETVHTGSLSGNTNVHAVFEYLVFCDSYGDNADKWLHIAANSNQNYHLQYISDDVIRSQQGNTLEAQEWCFVGNDDTFLIYNRAAGPDKVLTAASATSGSLTSMAEYVEGNPLQIWTMASTPTSIGIALKSAANLGLNQSGGAGGQIKIFAASDANSRWQLRKRSLPTSYLDRDGNVIADGAKYTFLCSYSGFYSRQKVMKGIYLNPDDKKLYWKTYDPGDDAFYFKAHVDYGIITLESVGCPGYYLTGATTEAATIGNPFTLNRLTAGDSNLYVNGGNAFHANNHGSGGGSGSNIINYNGGSNSASSWYVQRADDKKEEAKRYRSELDANQNAIDEANRVAARNQLKASLDGVFIGNALGQTPQDAWDAAKAVYDNPDLPITDYNAAQTALLAALNVPTIGSCYVIKSEAQWTDGRDRAMHVGCGNAMRWEPAKETLYQIWMVTDADEAMPTRLSFLNMGSNTFLKAQYSDANSTTTTSSDKVYVNLVGAGEGIFKIQSLTSSSGHTLLSAGHADNGNGVEGNVTLNNNAYNVWRIEEISEADMSILSDGEDERQAAREALRGAIAEVRSHVTTRGAIGYYNTLDGAIDAALAVYNDDTNIEQEYTDALAALRDAYTSASPVTPATDKRYVICLADGSQALHLVDASATEAADRVAMCPYDDTLDSQLWHMAFKEGTTYTLSNGSTSLDIVLTLIGRDSYRIEGFEGTFVIRPGNIETAHEYLQPGIYRIVNVASGAALANNSILVARTSMAEVDATCTDHHQIWTVEKLTGADRYSLRNYNTGRYLDQEVAIDATAPTSPGISPWRLQPGDNPGEFRLLTTEGMNTQYVLNGLGSLPLMAEAGAEGDLWRFEEVVPVVPEEAVYKVYTFKNLNKSSYMCATGTTAEQRRANDLPAEVDRSRWALIPFDFELPDGTVQTRYGIRNYFSGLYIQNVTTNQGIVSAGVTPVYFELINKDSNGEKRYGFKSPTNTMYLNAHGGNNTIIGFNQLDTGSTWIVTEVEGVTTTEREMMEKADAYEGFIAPYDGLICNIVNHSVGSYCDEDYKTMAATAGGANSARKSQLWRLCYDDEEAMYTIENLQTGDYLMSQTVTTAGRAFTTTDNIENAGHFTIATNPAFVGQRIYNIIDGVSGRAVFQNGTSLVSGDPSATAEPSAAEWRFHKVDISDEEIAAIRKKFNEQKHMTEHVEEYRVVFNRIFADGACTRIKDGISDEQWEAEMARLPEMLSDMCRKVKTDTWPMSENGRGWEKAFRVANYAITSNTGFANAWFKCGYGMSQLNNPCGITAHAGDVLAIMLDKNPPANSSLALQLVQGFNIRANTTVYLQPGLNLVQINNDCNLFLSYVISGTADDPRYYLDKFPDIKVHIEGGTVIGQLDRTRDLVVEKSMERGESSQYTYATTTREGANELWHDMLEDGLVRNAYMSQIKSRNVYFHFNANSVVNACPEKIGEVTDIWDWMLDCEWWLMGINNRPDPMHIGQAPGFINDYIPNMDKRFNGRWIAAERTGGYMNAQQGGGTQYNTSTIGNIMNFSNMSSGGGQWGPAHEFGHCHQSPINMCGMKETSNNLFSNVVTWEFGRQMSRGESLPKVSSVYGLGGHWYDLGIWACTQMYYKLYLYYHVAGNKPTFYQEVQQRLRKEPFSGRAGSAVPVSRDYLHFALICSEVAGEDLSDFFEAYGMFRDVSPENSLPGAVFEEKADPENGNKVFNCRKYADYSTYYLYSTPEMIEDYKARIRACGPKNTALLFIDDRFTSPACNEWAAEGSVRGPRDLSAGSQGSIGNVADFTPEAVANGTAPVGYKIYDEDGNLLYFTSSVNGDGEPLIPQNVLTRITELAGGEDKLVVAEVDSNNDVIEQADEDDLVYTLTTYGFNIDGSRKEPSCVSSAGRLKPMLGPNEMMVVGKHAEGVESRIRYSRDARAAAKRLAADIPDYKFADEPNVIIDNDGTLTMSTLAITDKYPLYLPKGDDDKAVVADHVSYSRKNTAGWNSVCLPFALSVDNLPEGSEIYVLSGVADNTIRLAQVLSVKAGQPCFVYCENGVGQWAMNHLLGSQVTTDVYVADAAGVHIDGSFENKTIGEGMYKLNGDGSAFGRTSAKGTIAPMRSYISPGTSSMSGAVFQLVIEDQVTGADTIVVDMEEGAIYNLNGIRIREPQPGQPYIHNGQIRIK